MTKSNSTEAKTPNKNELSKNDYLCSVKANKMIRYIKQLIKNFNQKGGIFLFLRAQAVSQIAAITDNLLAFITKKIFDISNIKVITLVGHRFEAYVVATLFGQICGGILSCFVNYKWTFKSITLKLKYVIIKFFFVWIGSIALNTYFTFVLTEWLKETSLANTIFGATNPDDIFIFAKLFVSILVGFFWNYIMYKHFVYKDIDFRKTFIRNHR